MYTLLVTGDVPGASSYFNPLLKQTIIPCTSGTRPGSPSEGMFAYETDTDKLSFYNGTAWVQTYALDTTPAVITNLSLIGTVASGFTTTGAAVRATFMLGAKLATMTLTIPTTGTISQTNGNITPDVLMFTITNTGLIPIGQGIVVPFSTGACTGDAFIDVDGTINLRTAGSNISTANNVRLTATYIVA